MADQLQTTRRVRILVAIDSDGKWVSAGHGCGDNDPKDWIMLDDLNEVVAYRWVEANVPLPSGELVIEGSAENAE